MFEHQTFTAGRITFHAEVKEEEEPTYIPSKVYKNPLSDSQSLRQVCTAKMFAPRTWPVVALSRYLMAYPSSPLLCVIFTPKSPLVWAKTKAPRPPRASPPFKRGVSLGQRLSLSYSFFYTP